MAVEPETGLVTANMVTAGNAGDADTAAALLAGEDDPVEVLGDTAYGAGALREHLDDVGDTAVIKPPPLRPAVPGGFDRDDFIVDHDHRTVTCPNNHTVPIAAKGTATFGVRCRTCPLRTRCTSSRSGPSFKIREDDRYLVAARKQTATPEFQQAYRRWRPMVERSIAWLMRDGHRRCRYRGVARNQLGFSLRVAAVNLQRLLALGLGYEQGWKIA